MYIDSKVKTLENLIQGKFKESKNMAINYIMKLDALSPLKTLSRGYSVTEHEGKVLSSINNINQNDIVQIRLQDGKFKAEVIEKEEY